MRTLALVTVIDLGMLLGARNQESCFLDILLDHLLILHLRRPEFKD